MRINSKNYAEVLEVLNNFDKEEFDRIPEEVIDYINKNSLEEKISLDFSRKLEEQISKESLTLLTYIVIKYVANTEQKKKMKEELVKNQKEHENEKKVKYRYEEMFIQNDNDRNKNEIKEQASNFPTVIDENLFIKFMNKIKQIILRLFK